MQPPLLSDAAQATPSGPDTEVAFAIGPFKLIPGRRILLRGDRTVKVGSRALDILHLLVKRAGEEVSKKALLRFAWPDVVVDDRNLKVHIRYLRQALEDTLPQATYIATVVGRGYQFVGPVRKEHAHAEDSSSGEESVPSGLPAPSHLVGRRDDIENVSRTLDLAELVTLVGPGGVGKTSLAVAVAHARSGSSSDAVRFVDFAAIDDPALVPDIVAAALGVRADPADLVPAVVGRLRDKRTLVILDNCEHVMRGVATTAAMLVAAKTGSSLLATSRAPLGVRGESVYRVGPLGFPERGTVASVRKAVGYPSIELFALRARETSDYRMVDGDAAAVACLCEALDGLPLAIEIVAALLDRFTPESLLASVGGRLDELRREGAPHSRHRTIRATVDWSYGLLNREEATMLRLLSVFAGVFAGADVAVMASLARFDGYRTTVALSGLVAKSLVSPDIYGDEIRYRIPDTVRRYASERLLHDPLFHEAHHRHARLAMAAFEPSASDRAEGHRHPGRKGRTDDLRKAVAWSTGLLVSS